MNTDGHGFGLWGAVGPRSQHATCGLTLEDPDVRPVAKALRTGTVRAPFRLLRQPRWVHPWLKDFGYGLVWLGRAVVLP